MAGWEPPPGWTRVRTLEAHTGGEPLRIVTSGWPALPGETILAKRRYAREHCDALRRTLMLEPRGHADMYGAVMTEPVTEDGDLGVLFLHNEGFSTMCGHGVIALVTAGLQCGLFDSAEPDLVRLDTPAGRVTARAEREGERIAAVSFENVPSFVLRRDAHVEVDGLGSVRYDLAYGGAFYALVDAADVGVAVEPDSYRQLIDVGMRIKEAVAAEGGVRHPDPEDPGGTSDAEGPGDDGLDFLYGTILIEPGGRGRASRNVCIFADGEVDRSPTGTGVSARAALHVARGELALGETLTIESVLGTSFDVSALRACTVGELDAIVPQVRGSAHLCGRHEFWLDPRDPLGSGVLLR